VLIGADEIWVGVSRVNDFQRIPRTAAGHDWARLEDALKVQKASAWFEHKTDIEIAADSTRDHPVSYHSSSTPVSTNPSDIGELTGAEES
jgi:hypothetical protein